MQDETVEAVEAEEEEEEEEEDEEVDPRAKDPVAQDPRAKDREDEPALTKSQKKKLRRDRRIAKASYQRGARDQKLKQRQQKKSKPGKNGGRRKGGRFTPAGNRRRTSRESPE